MLFHSLPRIDSGVYVAPIFGNHLWLYFLISMELNYSMFSLTVPIAGLADLTAQFTLVIFTIINLALIVIKNREKAPPPDVFVCPRWVPVAGLISSVTLLALDLVVRSTSSMEKS